MKPADRGRAWNSTLPARSSGLARTPFPVPLAADGPPRFSTLTRSAPVSRTRTAIPVPVLPLEPASRTETGFSRRVKLLVRTRAGSGDPDMALCEACGKWLGRRYGQVHHRVNRGAGGCRDEVINSCAGAALLCGTSLTGCHGLATALDADMKARGFVVEHGTTPEFDPRNAPVMLASPHGPGMTAWLAMDGKGPDGTGYLKQAPEARAAA